MPIRTPAVKGGKLYFNKGQLWSTSSVLCFNNFLVNRKEEAIFCRLVQVFGFWVSPKN